MGSVIILVWFFSVFKAYQKHFSKWHFLIKTSWAMLLFYVKMNGTATWQNICKQPEQRKPWMGKGLFLLGLQQTLRTSVPISLEVHPIFLLAFCTAFVCAQGKGRCWERSLCQSKSRKDRGLSCRPFPPPHCRNSLAAKAACQSAPLPLNPMFSGNRSSYQVSAIAFLCIPLSDRPVNTNLFLKWT